MKTITSRTGFLQALCLLLSAGFLGSAAAQDAIYDYKVVNSFPHNIESFTQGLLMHEGHLYEGTGKEGRSTLSRIDLESGEVLQSKPLANRYFGEGIEIVGDKIYQLTWQSHVVFVHDKTSFETLDTHYNPGQGWGLAYNGEHLILSDGSATLQFLNPETFVAERRIKVQYADVEVPNLNELEYIDGEIWANVWLTDYIVRIDPATGHVNSLVDLTGLSAQTELGSNEAVLNGIAWDAPNERLLVTGKFWSNIFEIELVER